MIDNPTTVEAYVKKARERFKECLSRFIELADVVTEAKLLLSANDFRQFCVQIGISYQTGIRWAKIGRSNRIKNYLDRLSSVEWGALYEITVLSEAEFKEFENEHLQENSAPQITRSLIKTYKRASNRRLKRDSEHSTTESLLIEPILIVRCRQFGLPHQSLKAIRSFVSAVEHNCDVVLEIRDDLKRAVGAYATPEEWQSEQDRDVLHA